MNLKSIAHYEILDKLGEGGMGTVFRARDTRLGREVAVKALPEVFQADAERLARFEREAKLLASLNHPNIAGVYGLEESEGRRYLIMELAAGEDLTQRIARGSVPWRDAVPIALGIARALEAAHENTIIHRDLKPGNIKVTPEGVVKVLDFGLAKALEGEPAQPISGQLTHSPTISGLMTGASVILGTAAYMSPEQARGHKVDRRADIWSFGVVLFEMLAGRQLFHGETVSDTLASVLKEEADWKSLPADAPPVLVALLRRCLERNPAQRLRDIGEARIILERIQAGDLGETSALPEASGRRTSPVLLGIVGLAALVLGAGGSYLLRGGARDGSSPRPVRKVQLAGHDDRGTPELPAISPDGSRVAYVKDRSLWVRDLDRLDPRRLDGTEGAEYPFWSPDGVTLGYFSNSRLMRIDVTGGSPVSICDIGMAPSGGFGGSWGDDGNIYYSRGSDAVYAVLERGGEPHAVAVPDTTIEQDYHEPSLLPGGRGILAVSHRNSHTADTIVLLHDGARRELLAVPDVRVYRPVYAGGYLLYGRQAGNSGVWAVPFSLERLETTGDPFLVLPESNWPSVASEGTLVAVRGGGEATVFLVEADATGRIQRRFGEASRFREFLALSPDGGRLIAGIAEGTDENLWLIDLERETRTRLTFGAGPHRVPAWSPDGRRFLYTTGSGISSLAVVTQPVDGSGGADTLVTRNGWGGEFTADAGTVLTSHFASATEWDVHALTGPDLRQDKVLVQGPSWEYGPVPSPDGRYFAYVSRESGRDEIYLKRLPDGSGKWQISNGGGIYPRWNADGTRLYYANDQNILEVEVALEVSPVLGTPRVLFTRTPVGLTYMNGWPPHFAVSRDGRRFYFYQDAQQTSVTGGVVLVQNWAEEFDRQP